LLIGLERHKGGSKEDQEEGVDQYTQWSKWECGIREDVGDNGINRVRKDYTDELFEWPFNLSQSDSLR
jgi:hypothetical protein